MAKRPEAPKDRRSRDAGDRPYGVVDIGSNSVRLVIYDRLRRAPFQRFNEKSMCRLGAGLSETGRMDEIAIRRTIAALCRFRAVADAMGVARLDVIATEAARRAANGRDLVDGIRDATGLEARILEGGEEARLGALGVLSGFYRPVGIVGDIGGGSVDIGEVADDQVGERTASLPFGALPVTEMLRRDGRAAKRAVDDALHGVLPPLLDGGRFYAVGGGWRAIAAIHMARVDAPVKVAHGYEASAGEIRALAKALSRLSEDEIAALPGALPRRQDTIAASALVLERILRALRPESVVFSAFGLREGWMFSQLEDDRYHDPLLEGAHAFAAANSRVPAFAAALAGWTDDLFPAETAADRRLRIAACALSDVAWRDQKTSRGLQTFRRLVDFPFVGVTHAERVFLAATVFARYAGKMSDDTLQPGIGLLKPARRRRAEVLGRALLLAYRFAGCVPEILAGSTLRIDPDGVRIEVDGTATVPDSDAVGARAALLAKALNLPVRDSVLVERSAGGCDGRSGR